MNSINNKKLSRALSGFLLVFFLVTAGSHSVSAVGYTVTNTNSAGAGSFRQAVENANANPGADDIDFNIPGPGPHDIIFTYLEVTDELHIDGTAGNGGSSCATDSMPAKPNIILNINGAWNQRLDFSSSADGSSIKGISYANAPQNMGLYANDFTMTCTFMDMLPDGTATEGYSGGGVSIEKDLSNIKFGGSDIADRNYFALISLQGAENVHGLQFENNYVGVNTTGSASSSIAHAQPLLYLCDSGNNIEIKNNLLSGNGGTGIRFRSGYGCTGADDLTNVSIKGNKIGSNAAGDAVLSTNIDAIHLQHYASNTISNINIGGPNPEDRNIIVGQRYGVLSTEDGGATNGVTIENNYIGVGSDGAALGPLNSSTASIESGPSADGWKIKNNVVSGSSYAELLLRGDNHVVSGNKIGTDASASAVIGSRSIGIQVYDNNSIYSGNTIAGFSVVGIMVQGKNNHIKANYIGTNSSLNANLGSSANNLSAINVAGNGDDYWNAENTMVGGTDQADANYIYNYNGTGHNNHLINLYNAYLNLNSTSVLGNKVVGNGTKPIESYGDPKIINTTESSGDTTFNVDLNTNFSDGDYRLEFFSNPTAKNTHGQLDTTERVGAVNVTKSGTDIIEATIAGTGYTFPTMTATKIDNSSDGYGLTSNVGDYQMPTNLQIETDSNKYWVEAHSLDYEITQTISNLGPSSITDINFNQQYSNCFDITAVSASGTATDTGIYDNLTWTGNLEPNQTLVLTFTGDVPCDNGQIHFFLGYVNSISSSIGDVFETNYDNNNHNDDDTQIKQPQAPETDLAVTKTLDNPKDVAIGGTLNYTLTLTNNGPEDIDIAQFDGSGPNPFATSLFLDFMPFELNFAAGSSSNPNIPCSLFPLDTNNPGAASLLSNHPDHDIIQCTWAGNPSQILIAGQSISTTISAAIDVSSDLSFTNHLVSGWAQNDPDFSTMLDPFSGATNQCAGYADILDCYAGTGINNYAAATPMTDLDLKQTLVNTGDISAGDTVNYDITITNKGPGALDLATLDGSLGANSLLGNVYPAADITFVDGDNTDVSCMDFGPGSYAYLGPAGQDHPAHQLINCFYSGSSRMLNPGDSLTVRLSFTANPGVSNNFTNYAVANGVSSDPDTAQINNLFGSATSDILDVVSNENYSKATYVGTSAVADLRISKTLLNIGKISDGDNVDYDITIANDGPADLDLNTLNGSQGANALFSDIYPGADLTFTDDNNPNVSCYDVGPGSIAYVGTAGQDHPTHQILSCVYTGGSQLLRSGDSLTVRLSFSADIGVTASFTNYVVQTGTTTDQDTQILGNMIGAATTDILDSISNGNFAKAVYTYTPISTNNDNDNDGVSNIIEDAGPNGGDANNDGTLDSLQKNVTSFVNSTTNQRAVLSVSDDCTITKSVVAAEAANTKQDLAYVYPVGLMDFELDCGTPGYVADITQYYFDASDQDYIVRKYNTNDDIYSDIDSASVTEEIIAGKSVVKASYQITDGGDLDMDQKIDGNIADPAGLALANEASNSSVQVEKNSDAAMQKAGYLPKTGQSETVSLFVALGFLISSIAVFNTKREKNLG